uniref:Serum response factor-binding protein 1 n=1 Tax=Anopheles culicifacies TaxID=139723 RepID=A0A182M0P9_9DIPT
MDKSKLIKEINTLSSLVKATRVHLIRKLIRDHKVWTARAEANSGNLRAKKKAETSEAILNHLKSITPSVLVEEVIRYQPLKNGATLETAPVTHRSMARLLQDAKLSRHLKSLESQFDAGASSKLLAVVQKRRTIKLSLAKKQRKERIIKLQEKRKRKALKKGKQTASLKKRTGEAKQLKPEKTNEAQEMDDEENRTTEVCDSYESDDESDASDAELDHTGESDDGEELDEQSESSISVSEDEHYSSDEEQIDQGEELPRVENESKEKRNDPPRFSQSSMEKTDLADGQNMKQPNKKKKGIYKAPEEEDEKDGYEMITDSFFVTDTGDQYVAVAPKLKPQHWSQV